MLNMVIKPFLVTVFVGLPLLACAEVNNNHNAQNLLNSAKNHRQSATSLQQTSYFYLLGLPYKADNLSTVGQALFNETQKIITDENLTLEQQSAQLASLQKRFTEQYGDFQSPTSKVFCQFKDTHCTQTIFAQINDWQTLLDENRELYQRYQQFLAQPPAVTFTHPMPAMPIPYYTMLTKGQRLSLLHKLKLARQGHIDQAITNSLADLAKLREQLSSADTLMGKMVMNQLVTNELQALILLKINYPTRTNTISPISALSDKEKSMDLVLVHEFELQVNTLRKIQPTLPPYQQKFYQHTQTVNALADFMQQQIALSQRSNADFAHYIQQPISNEYPIKVNRVTNFIGHTLVNIAIVDFQQYSQRLRATDNAINITNYVLTDNKLSLKNTFSPVVTAIHQDNQQVCMALPKPTKDIESTCLTVSLD